MAKRISKSKKKNVVLLALLSFVFIIFVFVTMFFDGAVLKDSSGNITDSIKGYDLAFGKEYINSSVLTGSLKANIVLAIGYILPLVLMVFILVAAFMGKMKLLSGLSLLMALSLIISTIGFFTIPTMSEFSVSVLGVNQISTLQDMDYELSLLSILAGVGAGLGFISSLSLAFSTRK
ncbi:MAG TPA: hypothetical protein PKC96_05970 [Bacilli bacterium]|nr:hypothetical protein [Bacilli bacterium]